MVGWRGDDKIAICEVALPGPPAVTEAVGDSSLSRFRRSPCRGVERIGTNPYGTRRT